jgi:hypothetical protein
MSSEPIDRRRFLYQAGAGVGALAATTLTGCDEKTQPAVPVKRVHQPFQGKPTPYNGPNVILVRFGGGVRRRETIEYPDQTYCPFIYHELAGKHGVLFNNVVLDLKHGNENKIDTSHGQGTLYILTGQYRHYEDISRQPFADRFLPQSPTIFELLRERYQIPEQQALIINGEDRVNEEFYTFSNNHLFGVQYKSMVLSLYGFKKYLLREQLKDDKLKDKDRKDLEEKLEKLVQKDYLASELGIVQEANPVVEAFWRKWRDYYGSSGFVNPRGDRLLTTLAKWSLKELRPRLLMINYQDPDYVHWGNPQFYTRAISIIDEGVREIYEAVQADEMYRDNTVFVVVPDCGRDNNRTMAVPFQHHFNTRSAREIFAVVAGPKKLIRDRVGPEFVITSQQEQISVASTIGEIMNFPVDTAEAPSLLKIV